MTVLKAPFMSEEARGTLAGLITFSRRRGRSVAGVANRPRQPRTEAQRATRIFMTWLTGQWAALSGPQKATWLNFPDTPLLSPYHAFLSHNVNRFKNLPGTHAAPATYPNWPGKSYPVGITGGAGGYIDDSVTPGVGYLDFTRNNNLLQQLWAFAYFRTSPENPEPCYRSLVAIETIDAIGYRTTRIANLPPGPIVIDVQRFSTDGQAKNWWEPLVTTIL